MIIDECLEKWYGLRDNKLAIFEGNRPCSLCANYDCFRCPLTLIGCRCGSTGSNWQKYHCIQFNKVFYNATLDQIEDSVARVRLLYYINTMIRDLKKAQLREEKSDDN